MFNIFKKKKKFPLDNIHSSRYVRGFTKPKEGGQYTYLSGFKNPIRGVPRGWVLKGTLDPIKRFFEKTMREKIWDFLPDDDSKIPIEKLVKITYPFTSYLEKKVRQKAMDLIKEELPFERLSEPVKEIWRIFEEMENEYLAFKEKWRDWKRLVCFFLEEDTAYRYRCQWVLERLSKRKLKKDPLAEISRLFDLLIEGEQMEGMKQKWRDWKKAVRLVLRGSPDYLRVVQYGLFQLRKSRIKLTKGDKEFFMMKFFNVS